MAKPILTELCHAEVLTQTLHAYSMPITMTYTKRDIRTGVARLYGYPVHGVDLMINRVLMGDEAYQSQLNRTLAKFQTYDPFFSRFHANPDSLQYLDLRFPGRVYMKFHP